MVSVQDVIRKRSELHRKIIAAVADVPSRERAIGMILNWVPLAVLKEIQLEFLKPVEDRMSREELIELAAEVSHEVNRAYCEQHGDKSQLPWGEAPDWQKSSARLGQQQIIDGKITEPHQSHVGWWEQKIADGWTWGPVKDPEKKEHPCMVPFSHLPAEQQTKDYLFFAVGCAFARHVS